MQTFVKKGLLRGSMSTDPADDEELDSRSIPREMWKRTYFRVRVLKRERETGVIHEGESPRSVRSFQCHSSYDELLLTRFSSRSRAFSTPRRDDQSQPTRCLRRFFCLINHRSTVVLPFFLCQFSFSSGVRFNGGER